jgi:hypothetical protein
MNRIAQAAARAYLASLAEGVHHGSIRTQCPFCNGGTSGEVSLVLTVDDDGTFYCCHRAACGARGTLGNVTRVLGIPISSKPKPAAFYDGPVVSIDLTDPAARRWVAAPRGRSSVTPADAGLFSDDTRVPEIWYLRDTRGEVRGQQIRYNATDTSPKRVKTYKNPGETRHMYSAHIVKDSPRLYVVEDPLSAAVLYSWGFNSVALLGTYGHHEVLSELAGLPHIETFCICLDPGAEQAAQVVAQSLMCYTSRPLMALYLPKDIKDMSVDVLRHYLT